MDENQKSFQWLNSILSILRRECPWDSVQTIDSLRYLTIEEVYELSEAIVSADRAEMRKELGDLFMHLLFYAQLAEDEGSFSLREVLDGICAKLIARHPHIALPDREGKLQPARTATADVPRWEQVKMREGRRSVLEGVPKGLPPLVKAIRIQEKASGLGFEFPDRDDAHAKAEEERRELEEAVAALHAHPDDAAAADHAEEELGDLLFALVKWARLEGLNADSALMKANDKFERRFAHVEQRAREQARSLSELSTDEMAALWQEAKLGS